MSIVLVGASHKSASLEIREQLSAAITAKGLGLSREKFAGWLLLSTCNRMELYVSIPEADIQAAEHLKVFLRKISGLDHATFHHAFYHKVDGAAVRHLFRVASSLDSLVLGENEILAQMKQAWQSFQHTNADGRLNRLFQHALQTGKRVRRETDISKHPVSVASVAVSFVKQTLEQLDHCHALVIGAGEMGSQVAQRLKDRQIKKLSIMSQRGERAKHLAEQLNALLISPADLNHVLHDVDVVITATGAVTPMIQISHIQHAIENRTTPLLLLDLGVPRDIDPEVRQLPGVSLFNIDHLQTVVAIHRQKRAQEIPMAEHIIDAEVKQFSRWMLKQRSFKVLHGV